MYYMFTTDRSEEEPSAELTTSTEAAVLADSVPLLDGPACPCGALAENRQTECHKCRARGRWQRRAAGRGRRPVDGLLVTLALLAVNGS